MERFKSPQIVPLNEGDPPQFGTTLRKMAQLLVFGAAALGSTACANTRFHEEAGPIPAERPTDVTDLGEGRYIIPHRNLHLTVRKFQEDHPKLRVTDIIPVTDYGFPTVWVIMTEKKEERSGKVVSLGERVTVEKK